MGRGLTQMTEYAVPILPSRNLRETLAFYERLGFENRGAPPEEWDYMILGRGGVELHFFAAPDTDPLTTSASCYVFVPDAEACMRSGNRSAYLTMARPAAASERRWTPTTGCASSRSLTAAETSSASVRNCGRIRSSLRA
jgi:hypothetical protein